VCVCGRQGHNIFTQLNSEQYSEVMNLLKQAILATDLSLHIQYVSITVDLQFSRLAAPFLAAKHLTLRVR